MIFCVRMKLKNADDNMNMAQDLRPLGPREEHRYSPALLSRLPPRSPPLLERNTPTRPETRPASSGCGCPSPQSSTGRFNIKSLLTSNIHSLLFEPHYAHNPYLRNHQARLINAGVSNTIGHPYSNPGPLRIFRKIYLPTK